jgi:hypothetical protein
MRVAGRNFVSTWPSFEFENMRFSAEAHAFAKKDERRDVFFTRPQDRELVQRRPNDDEVTKLSYMAQEGQGRALFIGMSVATAMRRAGVGRRLFDYFAENVGRAEGLDFVGTGTMNKPVIALIVSRAGLMPKSMDCVAEIMPSELAADPQVPVVRFLNQTLPPSDRKDSSVYQPFYEIAASGAFEQIPVDPAKVVPLHTGYIAG